MTFDNSQNDLNDLEKKLWFSVRWTPKVAKSTIKSKWAMKSINLLHFKTHYTGSWSLHVHQSHPRIIIYWTRWTAHLPHFLTQGHWISNTYRLSFTLGLFHLWRDWKQKYLTPPPSNMDFFSKQAHLGMWDLRRLASVGSKSLNMVKMPNRPIAMFDRGKNYSPIKTIGEICENP